MKRLHFLRFIKKCTYEDIEVMHENYDYLLTQYLAYI